jgi:hypothetical protein
LGAIVKGDFEMWDVIRCNPVVKLNQQLPESAPVVFHGTTGIAKTGIFSGKSSDNHRICLKTALIIDRPFVDNNLGFSSNRDCAQCTSHDNIKNKGIMKDSLHLSFICWKFQIPSIRGEVPFSKVGTGVSKGSEAGRNVGSISLKNAN